LRETIAAVWCQVLGLENVSHDENFFELGGHSLRATAVVARLRSTLAMEIPLALIFEKPTVRGMAGELRKLSAGDALVEEPNLRAHDLSAGIPLSRAQQRLWFLHQLEPDNPNYNVALAARITGNLDIAAFARSVEAVITRHDILNARIANHDQQPVMLPMNTSSPLPVKVISLDAPSVAQGSDEAMRLLTQASRVPFRLDRERPVRVLLVATAPELFHVMVLMDHIVTDGWSMGIFAHALFACYEADIQHLAPPDVQTVQYGDFTAWWDQQVEEKLLAKQLAYWKLALADLPQLALPTDTPRPSVASFGGARLPFMLDKVLSAQLRRIALQYSSTLFMVLLTAFEVVLRRRSGLDEIVIGTDISGRDHPLSERIIGFFVNQLVLRTDFRRCKTFADMLAEVRRCTLDSFYHQHMPFEELVKELNPSRDSTGTPFFQHKFVLQNAPAVQLQADSFVIEPIDIDTGTSKYDLLLTVIDEDVLRGTLEISTDLFSTTTAQAIVSEFTTVLTQVTADATISYDSLVKTLNAQGDARANIARSELRRSGLQRLRDLTRTGTGTA
jgi:acyl carrier protein